LILPKSELVESSSTEYLKMLSEAEINPEDYQAIFFLPFANTCGDKLLFDKTNFFIDLLDYYYPL
jgi:hypothetical protein